ncbi:GPI-anchored wall transfer protein 1 [Zalerion maritima]|uniref:GPI-anchored wall transfer protein n=1 Tax=Zalerion maritima TaxID=339359 RepID=A0AAD5WSH0_9PEZI|nr:GPI-anchored wall transfer protein 1 [Zalerion maritima]
MSNPSADYKKLKEDFVSGLTGGDVSEIYYVTGVAPVAMLVWSVLQSRQAFFKPYTPQGVAIDFLLNVCVFLLATTLYSNEPVLLSALLLAQAIFTYAFPVNTPRKKAKVPPTASRASGPLDILPPKPFITSYRGGMLIATVIAILAVDFHIFPRRFAKVETWGTSLMDMGVGAFVFSAGLVAARPVYRERAEGTGSSLSTRMVYAMRHSVPLFVLGFIRLISVKGLDYAEHVTEYGVHWNFFFTLALLPPFVAVFQSALKIVPSYAAMALILAVAYQIALETTSLKAFILAAPRVDLLSKNREGIFSFVGYLAIFLAGQDLGMFVLPHHITKIRSGAGVQRNNLLMTMAVWSTMWSALYFVATSYKYGFGLDVSRRMANLPYVLWVAAFNTAQLFVFCLIDSIYFPATYNASDKRTQKEAYESATSWVLRAYNRNGLALFLIANLLTGLVNLTVRTLEADRLAAIGILGAYAGTVTAVALALDAYNISIKL